MKEFTDPVIVDKECPVCGKSHQVVVEGADLVRWQGGVLIQNAFPYLSPDLREILQTGIDGECFDKLWAEPPDTEPPEPEQPSERYRLQDVVPLILSLFPRASIGEDNDAQVIIYTDMTLDKDDWLVPFQAPEPEPPPNEEV